jgi:hypothetical protein
MLQPRMSVKKQAWGIIEYVRANCDCLIWPFLALFGDNWKILKPIRLQGTICSLGL